MLHVRRPWLMAIRLGLFVVIGAQSTYGTVLALDPAPASLKYRQASRAPFAADITCRA
ncbi:MAG: hypothetical protein H7338_14295 [Candidatus Sericytochromatia bacterium]|nr:hypothetical protein [Candidatus Sericytochromatia bacterium]